MGCITELLEELPNTGTTATLIPRNHRQPLHKFIDRRKLLAEDIFDPVLDFCCELIVLRLLVGEGDE